MTVKILKSGEIIEVNSSYAMRLAEQGKAAVVKTPAKKEKPKKAEKPKERPEATTEEATEE